MVFAFAGDSTMTRGLAIEVDNTLPLPARMSIQVVGSHPGDRLPRARGCPVRSGPVLNPTHLLNDFGALGVFLILFAETGLLIGIILPGDSLLFTAGVLSATRKAGDVHLNLGLVILAALLGAVLGAQCGYIIGRKVGPRLFNREDSRFFKR